MSIALASQFAYVAEQNAGEIMGYTVNSANGKLTPIEGSPFTTGSSGSTSVAVDPAGRFLYATNQYAGDNNVSGFRIDCDSGRLTPIPGSPFASGYGPTAVAIDPSGRFAYVANLGANNVSAYTINPETGRLVQVSGSPYAAGTFPSGIAVDPMGKYVYVTNSMSNNVSGYAINSATGGLTPLAGSPYAAQYSPSSVAVDPNDRFVYVANGGSDDISGYSIAGGTLSPLPTSPFAAGAGGVNSVTVDPSGQFVFLAGYGGLFAYSINQNQLLSATACLPRLYTGNSRRSQVHPSEEETQPLWRWTTAARFSTQPTGRRTIFLVTSLAPLLR